MTDGKWKTFGNLNATIKEQLKNLRKNVRVQSRESNRLVGTIESFQHPDDKIKDKVKVKWDPNPEN